MMPLGSLPPLLGLLALVAFPARAAEVSPVTVACPVGGGPVKVFELVSQNTHGGWDSDGARYSSGGQWRTFEIATCPDNLLTLYGHDMRRAFSQAEVERLDEVLGPVQAAVKDPRALTTWERYAIAARAYEALGADGWTLARLYVKASWTVRDHAVGFLPRLEGPATARAMLLQGAEELDKELPLAKRRLLLLNLARVAHRAGYAEERQAWLEALAATGPLTPSEVEARTRLELAIEAEPRLQDQAIAALEALLVGPSPEDVPLTEARYLLADLYRRRGRTEEALALYDRVSADPEAPEQLIVLSGYLASELRGGRPWEALGESLLPMTP